MLVWMSRTDAIRPSQICLKDYPVRINFLNLLQHNDAAYLKQSLLNMASYHDPAFVVLARNLVNHPDPRFRDSSAMPEGVYCHRSAPTAMVFQLMSWLTVFRFPFQPLQICAWIRKPPSVE
ncbi:hypothetical protein HZ326_0946 [Fusarium oxysporum f. sp. albedinis]|nr:hypothetical protein HZ326_0946 [Fusarium oxysporum f. sp. albedinis]